MAEIENIRFNEVEVKLADTDNPIALKISREYLRLSSFVLTIDYSVTNILKNSANSLG